MIHECKDCGLLPEDERPRRPRPVLVSCLGAPRCKTHERAFREARRRRSWESRIRSFGIDPELYWAVYEAQGRKCAIRTCRATGKTKMLAVEHDHELAARECDHDPKAKACRRCFRGVVCGQHNYYLLGIFRNSLQDALDYLADPPARRVLSSR